jgi:hypothetical protein
MKGKRRNILLRRDKIEKLFKHAVEKGVIQLPTPKRSHEVDKLDCDAPKHGVHKINDYFVKSMEFGENLFFFEIHLKV